MTSRLRKLRGFTLIELMVGFMLLGILGVMFVWFIVPVMRMAQLGTTRVDIQQMAVLACNRIAADLQRSSASGVSLHSKAAADPAAEPVVVAIVPISDVDEEGRRMWHGQAVTYFWDRNSQKLLRRTFPSVETPAPTTKRPAAFESDELIVMADPTARVIPVATRVVSFDARKNLTAEGTFTVDISIEQGVSGKQKAERFDYRKVVSLRN